MGRREAGREKDRERDQKCQEALEPVLGRDQNFKDPVEARVQWRDQRKIWAKYGQAEMQNSQQGLLERRRGR